MAPRLIVNADDLGMSPGVNKGIVESMINGVVTSTSLMVNMPSAPQGVAQALQHKLAVGMHLNLTSGRPILPPRKVPSLVRADGTFHTHAEFRRRLIGLQISLREMYLEFSAQVEAARRMGIEPTHLDTHHHLHLWLPVAGVLLRVGRRYGIRGTRTTRTADMVIRVAPSNSLGGWAKRRYKAVAAALLRTWFRMPAWRMDASVFRTQRDPGALPGADEWFQLVRHIEKLPTNQVVEVPCHPGYFDDELKGHSTYVEARQQEISILTSSELRSAIAQAGIELVSFRDL